MGYMVELADKTDIKILRVAIASILNEDVEMITLLEDLKLKVIKEIEESKFYQKCKNTTTFEIADSYDTYGKIQYLMSKGYLEAIEDLMDYHSRIYLKNGNYEKMKNIISAYKEKEV